MPIEFYKYQGAGNDFILIDNRNNLIDSSNKKLIVNLCDRRFGIGSDGIIFLENDKGYDFKMNFYNPDASQSFCGNGSRCVVAFAREMGIIQNEYRFVAIDGVHLGKINTDSVMIQMNNVDKVSQLDDAHFANTGSPHLMKFVSDVDRINVKLEGSIIRFNETYKKEGVNVNFIQVMGENHIKVRTYERGVENETFACGTGATACALAYLSKGADGKHLVKVDVKGGTLYIHTTKKGNCFSEIWLEGPAIKVFKGVING